MKLFDKHNILVNLGSMTRIDLELGCGSAKTNLHAIGIDILDYPCVDLVGDVYEALSLFPSQSVDAVYSSHFIEHIPDVSNLMTELGRVVKFGGLVEFFAPHFSNPYFYSDLTHRSFFGLYTFCYLADVSPFKRKVPTYGNNAKFGIVSVDLIFKSPRPFVIRYGIKNLFGKFFNSCTYLKELYEENLCYIFPCYEIRYILIRHRDMKSDDTVVENVESALGVISHE